MENYRIIKFLIPIIGGISLIIPPFILAYSDETTHPALTQETVKFFSNYYPHLALQQEEAELVIRGSIDEDKETRWLQHFYDPIYNRGLVLENDAFPNNPELAVIASGARVPFLSSKSWALSSRAQGGILNIFTAGVVGNYYSKESDYSWERAIYEYVWGDKQRALLSLGHVLHLIQDTSVPDHTRNDPHPPVLDMGSPYEGWTKQFGRENIKVSINEGPITFNTISDYFDKLAAYSNSNFFSKDSIFHKAYNSPKILSERLEYTDRGPFLFGYGIDSSGRTYRLVKIKKGFTNNKIYSVEDNLILSDYWNLLSKQAVLHGAGVVKLFFDEVEKEKQTKALYNKNRSWLAKQVDKFKVSTFNLASVLYGSSVALEDLEEDAPSSQDSFSTSDVNPSTSDFFPPAEESAEVSLLAGRETSSDFSTPGVLPPTPDVDDPLQLPAPSPAPVSSNTSDAVPVAGAAGSPPSPDTAEASPPSGGETSEPSPPPPDTTPPDISLTADECGQSLSSDGCLVATTTVNLSWSSTADDLAHYRLECTVGGTACTDFGTATTTATTTVYTAPQDLKIYTFKVQATDTNGNFSEDTRIVEVSTRPVVINEIAWAGTGSSAATTRDEWIELYNFSSLSVNLSGWTLTTDSGIYIPLSGTIATKGYFILERTDNTAISDITADLTYGNDGSAWALNNSGEVLTLYRASTTIDKTPELSACSNSWCGGVGNPNYYTMERYDPNASGESASNWSTWAGFLNNGLNADDAAIKGTPKQRNSINYLITKNASPLNQDKTLTKANSPYLISNNFMVGSTASTTLAIEPGVVVKLLLNASLTVNLGAIIAQGTESDKIIFTSFKDDVYAGDTNQDGSASLPQAGDWQSIKILADGSVLNQTVIRYGGFKDFAAFHWANLRVENASTTITNSVFENSAVYGVWLKNSAAIFSGNTVRANTASTTAEGIGLVVINGSVIIQNNTFSANTYGLRLTSPGASHVFTVTNNNFTGNTLEAVDVNNSYPVFSGNTATANRTNGILYQGLISKNYTFSANLPYKISTGSSVSTSTTLTLDAGVILKFTNSGSLTVQGNFVANGTLANKVVFTSIKDDSFGGDTNNDGSATTPAKADWGQVHLENATATSTITHAIFGYGTTGLKLTNSSVSLDSVLFKTNTTGIQAIGTSTVAATGVIFGDGADANTTNTIPPDLIP